MRDRDASVESSGVPASSTSPLPDAELVTAAWTDPPPAGGFPSRPDKAKTVSGAMLAVGVAPLLFAALGGALFLVAGGLGLAIASEAPVGGSPTPPVTTNAATTAIQPQPSTAMKPTNK